jgi:hypothetical protein
MLWWNLNVSYNASSDKAILQGTQLRVLVGVDHFDVEKFDVEILIDAVQCSSQYNIILQLYSDFFPNQSLEEGKKNLQGPKEEEREISWEVNHKVRKMMGPILTHHDNLREALARISD